MIPVNAHISEMAPYALADLAAPAGKRLVSLAQNESAFAPSPRAIEAAGRALAEGQLYPDPDWSALRETIAAVHGLAPGQILCGAGSMELIDCVLRCYCGPGAGVLSTQYGYAFFRIAAHGARAAFSAAPEIDMTVDVDAVLDAVEASTRVVCIVNPGNPTGTRIPRSEVLRLRQGLRDDILMIIDEAYGEFADMPGEQTFDLASRGDTVVLRTFSKAYALAGMRVGWGVFPPAIAAEVRKLLMPNNISGASQAAAAAAMADQDHMRTIRTRTIELREQYSGDVRRLGLQVPQSHTNFIVVRFAGAHGASGAEAWLRNEGVIARGLAGYGLPDCLRVTVGETGDMALATELLDAWQEENQ
jgi:histidinol-phosphate aminotransferase